MRGNNKMKYLKKEESEYTQKLIKEAIWFDGMAIYENFGYVSPENFNGLFRINLDDFSTDYLGAFPGEPNQEALYHNVVKKENKLIFIPATANHIAIYDIVSNSFNMIPVKIEETSKSWIYGWPKFFNAAVYKKYVFLIACYYPAIVRLDIETGELLYLNEWKTVIKEDLNKPEKMYFRRDASACIVDNKVYLPCCIQNIVLELNMDTLQFTYYNIGENNQELRCMCFDNGVFWIMTWEGKTLIKWDKETNTIEESLINIDNQPLQVLTSSIFIYNNKLWCFPIANSVDVYCFNIEKSEWSEVKIFESERDRISIHPWKHTYPFAFVYENFIYTYLGSMMKLLKLDIKKDEIKSGFIPPEGIKREHILNGIIQEDIICETRETGVLDLVELSQKMKKKNRLKIDNNTGNKIYHMIKNKVESKNF